MLKEVNKSVLYVKRILETAEFYEKLGFSVTREDNIIIITLKDFVFEAVNGPTESEIINENVDSLNAPKGVGAFWLIEVENVDEYHKLLIEKGMNPSTKPRTWSWGRREFVIRDPDGYKLVFYQNV